MFSRTTFRGEREETRVISRFVVIADEPIKKNTLITEYVGEVDVLARNEHNSNDSIMDLLRTG